MSLQGKSPSLDKVRQGGKRDPKKGSIDTLSLWERLKACISPNLSSFPRLGQKKIPEGVWRNLIVEAFGASLPG